MTESEWLTSAEPDRMLEFLQGRAGERKLRLFACACCRRVWRLVPEAPGWTAVKVAERYADDLASRRELGVAQLDAERAHHRRYGGAAWNVGGAAARFAFLACLHAARIPLDPNAAREVAECSRAGRRAQGESEGSEQDGHLAGLAEAKAQAAVLRDIAGNPFHTAQFDPAWLTPCVSALALQASQERRLPSGELDLNRLAALAGALQDAGCTEVALLEHLRCSGPHVLGCWGLDSALVNG